MKSNIENKIMCSVIVLTYKQLQWLPDTIESIANQDYDNLEIIIADDGTPQFDYDEVEVLCEKLCAKKGIKYIIVSSDINQGTVKNFNKGIKNSNGDIIIPMAGDNMFFSDDAISRIVNSYRKNKWLIATGRQALIVDGCLKELRPYKNEIRLLKKNNKKNLAIRLAMLPCFIGGAVTFYTKELFDQYGMFDESYKLLEDCPYYVSVLLNNVKIEFIDDILIRHNIDIKIHSRNPLLILDDIKVIDDIFKLRIELSFWQNKMLEYRKMNLEKELGTEKKIVWTYIDCRIRMYIYHFNNRINKLIQRKEINHLQKKVKQTFI